MSLKLLPFAAGELEVVAEAGKGEVRLRTNGTRFDDGRLHTVRIIRMHKQVEIIYFCHHGLADTLKTLLSPLISSNYPQTNTKKKNNFLNKIMLYNNFFSIKDYLKFDKKVHKKN